MAAHPMALERTPHATLLRLRLCAAAPALGAGGMDAAVLEDDMETAEPALGALSVARRRPLPPLGPCS